MLLIKEEFVGGEKYRRAVELGGYDAIGLWLAMKRYCSIYPDTVGFVPNEELDGLPGAPRGARRKALQALIQCGRLLPGGQRGTGLVEAVAGGWKLHDYLDHSAPPEEIELRREKARLKKQSYREHKRRELAAVRRLAGELSPGTSGDTEGDSPGDIEGDSPPDTGGTVLAGARPHEGARVPAPTRGRALPNPTQPNPTKKNLPRLASTIREPQRIEAGPAHRQFAAEHGLELEPFLAQLRQAPSTEALSDDEIRTRLAGMLVQAVERRLGGAA
jgi:hypothetical protein